jgi:hypothetical protein
MSQFNFITAGESHGKGLVAIIGGVPATASRKSAVWAQTPVIVEVAKFKVETQGLDGEW